MTDSAVSIRASGKTGQTCTVSGPYRSARNSIVVFVRAGTAFPVDGDGAGTTWTLVTE